MIIGVLFDEKGREIVNIDVIIKLLHCERSLRYISSNNNNNRERSRGLGNGDYYLFVFSKPSSVAVIVDVLKEWAH